MMKSYNNIDSYIKTFPKEIQSTLKRLRKEIKSAAPKAVEDIKYGIPTFIFHGNLVHFGSFKKHIGFFPGASGVTEFLKESKEYQTSKGTIKFPLGASIPFDLVKKIVKFRVKENLFKELNK